MLWQARQGFIAGRAALDAAAAGGAATTWNPLDKTASLTLSGGNLVTTSGAGGQGVRSLATLTASQKVYIEFTPTVSANNQQFGFALATHTLGALLGSDEVGSKSFGVKFDGTYLDFSSVDNNAAMPSWTTGDRVDVAFDSGASRFWSRVNGGAWSNSGNPAAGTGGRVVSVTGTLYATLTVGFSGHVTTTVFSSASWVGSPPAGYTQLA